MIETQQLRFGGFNIRGTPRMSAERVSHDIRVIKNRCDVAFASEYRWNYYWGILRRLLKTPKGERVWSAYPSLLKGFAAPVFGAQVCMWDRSLFHKKDGKHRLLHKGRRKISESRQLRGVRLAEWLTGLDCWYAGTHYVVKGDRADSDPVRKQMMRTDLRNTALFLDDLIQTGVPIVFQLDANIHPGTWAYREFMEMIRVRGGEVIGEHGIEFLIIFDKHSKTKIDVVHPFRVAKDDLFTDHEGRGIVFRLVERGTK